jgi:CBS domain-containing protein
MARYTESDYERGRTARRDEHDRGMLSRAGDEVRSWFGDEDAERRRRRDERQGGQERDYGYNRDFGRGYATRESERSYPRAGEGGYGGDRAGGSDEHFDRMRAWEIMNRNVVTVRPGDTITLAARLMRETDCGALPVVDREGQFVGMITDRDITVRAVARGDDPRGVRVEQCMTDETFCCNADDSVEECMRQMARHQIRRLPIVDDRDRIVGIVSQGDIARHAGEHSGRGERRALADTISEISEPSGKAYR